MHQYHSKVSFHHQRKMLSIVILVALVSISSKTSTAAYEPMSKLKRGAINVLTAPVEIPKEIRSYWIQGSEKTFHISAWLFCGLVKGLVNTPVRLVSGVWDIVTFPIQTDEEHMPLYKPAYVFDEWPKRQTGIVYKNMGVK